MDLHFKQEDKEIIVRAENNRGYKYYEFTPEKIRAIAAKPVREVEYNEWCCFLQLLYPTGLICSGLFEPFLVFEIVNGKRKDPPKEHWPSLNRAGSDGTLIRRFIGVLDTHGIKAHDTWYELKMAIPPPAGPSPAEKSAARACFSARHRLQYPYQTTN